MAQVRSESEPQSRWSEVFSRSTLGSNVFYCRFWLPIYGPIEKPFEGTGIPASITGSLFGSTCRDAVFLDGGVIHREPPYMFGLRGGWIIGFGAFRYVCHLLDLVQPRRLKGEPEVPTRSQLRELLVRQVRDDQPLLKRRLRAFQKVQSGEDIQYIAAELARFDSWESYTTIVPTRQRARDSGAEDHGGWLQ